MDLSGIISIAGKPGLYKVVGQGKNNVIVESLIDSKRFPAHANNRISALEDISIYTDDEDKPLKEVLSDIFKKEGGKATISHKESQNKLVAYLEEVLPNYDKERVYASDVKKVFQWYNLLHKADLLKIEEPAKEESKVANKEDKPKKTPAKKTNTTGAKKTAPKTTGAAKAKSAPAKKQATTQRKAGK